MQSVDIRGNKVGDKGVEFIVKGLSHLKSLMVSETGITDVIGRLIARTMDNLEMFWGEKNHLSGEVALEIGEKPKVKVMSVAGNNIPESYALKLKEVFVTKGYIVI